MSVKLPFLGPLPVSEIVALRDLARLDAELIGRRRLGRGGGLRLVAPRRACLEALSRPVLDEYFGLVRRRRVPAVALASVDCGACHAAIDEELKARLSGGVVAVCPRCERLLVLAP
jgi:predicted  nucleic acid-binding Zn-ribbon protein